MGLDEREKRKNMEEEIKRSRMVWKGQGRNRKKNHCLDPKILTREKGKRILWYQNRYYFLLPDVK